MSERVTFCGWRLNPISADYYRAEFGLFYVVCGRYGSSWTARLFHRTSDNELVTATSNTPQFACDFLGELIAALRAHLAQEFGPEARS